jgi:hypothetical protein
MDPATGITDAAGDDGMSTESKRGDMKTEETDTESEPSDGPGVAVSRASGGAPASESDG